MSKSKEEDKPIVSFIEIDKENSSIMFKNDNGSILPQIKLKTVDGVEYSSEDKNIFNVRYYYTRASGI